MSGNDKHQGGRRLLRGYSVAASFGVVLVISILLAYYAGSYIDEWLGTSPWITLALMFLAMVSSFQNLLRRMRSGSGDENP